MQAKVVALHSATRDSCSSCGSSRSCTPLYLLWLQAKTIALHRAAQKVNADLETLRAQAQAEVGASLRLCEQTLLAMERAQRRFNKHRDRWRSAPRACCLSF